MVDPEHVSVPPHLPPSNPLALSKLGCIFVGLIWMNVLSALAHNSTNNDEELRRRRSRRRRKMNTNF